MEQRQLDSLMNENLSGPKFPEYSISSSKNAIQVRDGMTEKQRTALLKILDELADNPDQNPSRLVPLDENGLQWVYKHPDPPIEVTYRIGRERKILYVLHVSAPVFIVQRPIFISYSHKDAQWLLELKKWLKPMEQRDEVTIWDDQKIKAAADWRHEIEKALLSAKAAVLLISMDFLSSEFIANHELPQLLNAAMQRGVQVFWIAVRASNVEETDIAKYQAVHKDPPLADIGVAQLDRTFSEIYKKIKEAVTI